MLHVISATPQSTTSVGVTLTRLAPLPDTAALPRPTWVVLMGLPGQRIDVSNPDARSLLHWLRGLRLATRLLEWVRRCAQAPCWPPTRAY